jgi:hypothetical protein
VVCFKSHLVVGLSLPPNKFLVAIMNFLGCELVHFSPNVITALSYFTMLCEYWLGIALDTSLFLSFNSLIRYDKVLYFRIRLSLRRHRQKEYIDATFKSSWRGSSQRWFLVGMHVAPQWVNKHLLLPLIDNKWGEQEMTPCLAGLVKWVAELYNIGLRTCHCTKEFTPRWIHPLGHRDNLAYECSRLADPSREPADSKTFNFVYCC